MDSVQHANRVGDALTRLLRPETNMAIAALDGYELTVADLLVVPRGERSPGVVAEIDRLVRDLDPERKRVTAELAAATLPLPADPGLVALAEAIRVAERPVPDDPAIVRLRGDVEASTKQLADKRLTAIQDLAWALINSPAFFFNH